MEKKFGKSASSLLHILDTYPLNKSHYRYHFYCDNYFTSLPLCRELKSRGYNCTGTIRANRVEKDCPLTNVKEFAKKERGYTEVATAKISGENVFLNRWKDNAVVTVASTSFAGNPQGSVKRVRVNVNIYKFPFLTLSIIIIVTWVALTVLIKTLTTTVYLFAGRSGGGHCSLGCWMSLFKMHGYWHEKEIRNWSN